MTSALILAACGFEPIYKIDDTKAAVAVSGLEVTGMSGGRTLQRILHRHLSITANAPRRLAITLSEQIDEMQKGRDGVARRLRLTHAAQLRIIDRPSGAGMLKQFSVSQFMTRNDSGADELMQRRALADLAMQNLAEQILTALADTHDDIRADTHKEAAR